MFSGIHVDGGMQALLPVRFDLLHKSATLSLDQLAMIETLGIGAHAVERSELKAGEQALVIGAGPIGLGVILFAKAAGASVHAVERNLFRRTFAEQLGAEATPLPGDRLADVLSLTPLEALDRWERAFPTWLRRPFGSCGPHSDPSRSTMLCSTNGKLPFTPEPEQPGPVSCRIVRMMEEGMFGTVSWITDRMPLRDVPLRLKDLPTKTTLIKALVHLDGSDT